MEKKNSTLGEKVSDLESTNAKLTSTNKLLKKELTDSVEKEKITSQRLGQDLTKERQQSHTMSMRVDMLTKENAELAESLTKVIICVHSRTDGHNVISFSCTKSTSLTLNSNTNAMS